MKRLDPERLKRTVLEGLRSDFENYNFGGAAITVAQEGRVLLDERIGYKDVTTREPLRGGEMFRLASMTKPITGAAFLKARELGYFDMEDKVSEYFPEIAKMRVGGLEEGRVVSLGKPKRDILMYHLLSHQSGFMAASPVCSAEEDMIPLSAYETNETLVDYCLKNTRLTFEPAEAVGYCTTIPFDVVAVIIERKSGKRYGEFLRDELFAPLGIKDITFNPTEEQWARTVTMCDRAYGGGIVGIDMGRHIFEQYPLTLHAAGCGLLGSAEDYFRFAEMLRQGGELDGARVLSEDSVRLLRTPLVSPEIMPGGHRWSLGCRVITGHPTLPDGCFGWSGAYGTHFWIDRENDITALLMRNMRWHDTHGAGSIGVRLEKEVMSCLE